MHTQKRYATYPQGMSKKKRKDAYPKKVCHTPTRCVKKEEEKRENIAHTKNNTREREFI